MAPAVMMNELYTFLKLFVLMYADDTILLADNEIDLQKLLDSLHAFCEHDKLQVNTDKTKVMVFTRSKVRLRNLTIFKMGDTNLERVEEYNYLGMLFTWNGKFTKAKTKLAVKATRANRRALQPDMAVSLNHPYIHVTPLSGGIFQMRLSCKIPFVPLCILN